MAQNKTIKRKSTFFLSEELLSEIKLMVPAKGLRSQNALVEEALSKYVAEFRRDILRKKYEAAVEDPQFMADIDQVEKDFRNADAEDARMMR